MFEREIKFIYDFNLNKVNKLGPYFTFEQLASSGIHPAILHYISAEIDYLIFEDRQQLLKNSVFDYSGEKISLLFSQISAEVKHTKRFSLEYVSKLILHASSFTINFLVRPKWSLVKFVFDESDHKTTSEIKQILNYLYYYKHIKSILNSYITTKKILSMNSEEFKELLDKVDRLGVENYLSSILSGAVKSMAEFFNIGEVQKNRIPLVAITIFLEEKQLSKHLERIRLVFGEDGNTKFNMSEYQKEFDSIVLVKEEPIQKETDKERFQQMVVEEHDLEPEIRIETKEETFEEITKQDGAAVTDDKSEDGIESVQMEEAIKKPIDIEPEPDHKPVKIRIKVKENNEIERIDEKEMSEQKESDETEIEIQEEKTLFDNFEEDIIIDQPDQTTAVESLETIEDKLNESEHDQSDEIEVDKTADEIESALTEERNNYEEFDDDETKEIYKYADETLKNIEKKLDTDEEDEKESILQSIFNNADADDEQEIDQKTELLGLEDGIENKSLKTKLAELLEHKEMTKIIEVVFEYDIEEFSNVLEEIMNCKDIDEAHVIINQIFKERGFRRRAKETQLFKQIISQYFDRR